MPAMNIVLDGEGVLEGVPREQIIHLESTITVAAIEGGMSSGKPSVAFIFDLPDGRKVVAESSLALFQSAYRAFRGRFGTEESDFRERDA